jgi:hypothetical protein
VTSDELRRQLKDHGIHVPMSGLVPAKVAWQVLDVSPRTLFDWRRDKRGPAAVLIGGTRWHYSVDSLAAFISNGK